MTDGQKVIETGTIYGAIEAVPLVMADGPAPAGADDNGPDGDIQKIDQPAADNRAMRAYWSTVEALIEGVEAVQAGKETHMPKFPGESDDDYKYRLATATMTNVYRDIVEGLSSKPFAQEVHLTSGQTPEIETIVENVNGRGDHLHVFLGETFFRGINSAVHWILVDYPTVPIVPNAPPRSAADERALGLRPYWVQVRALDVLDVKTQNITGVEELSYIRIWETNSRVRVFDKRTGKVEWRVYTKDISLGKWALFQNDQLTIDVIPMVPFQTGRRKGSTWQFYPPMKDAAHLQIESYQAESGLKYARTLTAYSMLAANGVDPDTDANGKPKSVQMGPNKVLYAPTNGNGQSGTWERLVADAAGIKILMDDVKARHDQMREIGRQPLTAQSGNVTRISAAFAAGKSNSAVSAWAYGLKDAAEQALKITNKWLNSSTEPEIFVFTDFPIESDDNTVPTVLQGMRTNGDISRQTLWEEMQAQGVLSANFDPAKEPERIAAEVPDDPNAEDMNSAIGAGKKPGKPAPTPTKQPVKQ